MQIINYRGRIRGLASIKVGRNVYGTFVVEGKKYTGGLF